MKEKTNKISVYLLAPGASLENVLKKDSYKRVSFNDGGLFYYDEPHSYKPSWISNFFQDKLNDIAFFNQSSKGVYLAKVEIDSEERIFAIPFGYGHSMINKDYCVDDFGLKTVLNLVDRDSIRRIGKRTLSSEPKNTIEQLSKIGNISDFGIDIEQDLIEEITGKPNDDFFGTSLVVGKVAFTASVKYNITNIEEFLKKCFEYYKKDTYKENFAFIDQVKEIKNSEEWDNKLVEKLKNEEVQNIDVWMAIPEIIKWEDVAGFSYSGKKENLFDDITIDDFKNTLSDDKKNNLDLDYLKKNKVYCFKNSSDEEYDNWPIFKCIYCEITDNGRKILLTNGKWYEVAKDFVDEIENNYKNILTSSSSISLMDCEEKQHEDEYNESLAKSIGGILMDRKNIGYGGGASRVEFCDVYDSNNKSFIHVKNYYGSSALSHLFAQGRVSGQLFLSDQKFRKKAKETERSLPFDPNTSPNPADFKIVFGIISESKNELNIPFFSKVNFKNEKNLLNTFGFKDVYLTKIQRK